MTLLLGSGVWVGTKEVHRLKGNAEVAEFIPRLVHIFVTISLFDDSFELKYREYGGKLEVRYYTCRKV